MRERSVVFDQEIARLEKELFASQETLQRSLSELEALNEELEASSEELQASSEELQASNEELEASNEELEATNEELATMNQELSMSSERAQATNTDLENILACLNQGMVLVDDSRRVTRFSPLAVRVFALVANDIGRVIAEVPTTLAVPDLDQALTSVLDGGPRIDMEIGDDEASYLLQVLPYPGFQPGRRGAIITLTDITPIARLRAVAQVAFDELEAQSHALSTQASHDSITELLNRRAFGESLARELALAERARSRLALVWVDLDRFKEVNDECGHGAGDLVLKATADRLRAVVRTTDVVGRIGGDEFGVIIPGYDSDAELDAVLERITSAVGKPVDTGERELVVSGSVGAAIFPVDCETPEGMLRAADAAMYFAKEKGGNRFAYFTPSLNEAADLRRRRRSEIDAALEADDFELHYQPIVSGLDGRVWGAEALLRWNRDGALEKAGTFVPFCEESGQIRPLGRATLNLLRADLEVIRASGHADLTISFNMSVAQLEDPLLQEMLVRWPAPGGLDGMVVEILESVFLPEHRSALDMVERLTEEGAAVSVDDFGSGYSNLRLLATVSPDYVKLDQSFLQQRDRPEARSALIRAAVAMAHLVGAEVVAEGVEQDEQRADLLDAGVDFLQGYAIAHPMPLPELLAWLDEDR